MTELKGVKYITNPLTKRLITVGGSVYKRILKAGHIDKLEFARQEARAKTIKRREKDRYAEYERMRIERMTTERLLIRNDIIVYYIPSSCVQYIKKMIGPVLFPYFMSFIGVKLCGHSCDLISTMFCCSCGDKRKIKGEYSTELIYKDGRGDELQRVRKNISYCPCCQ